MNRKAMATLVKRSDAPLYRIWVGDDWKLFVYNLSHEQCFEVNAVLHAPGATSHAQDMVSAVVSCSGLVLQKNGRFEASQDQAMQVLAATLVPEQCCANVPCIDAPAPRKRLAVKCAFPVSDCEQCAAPPVANVATPVADLPSEETDASSAPDSPESCVIQPDATDAVSDNDNDPLWQYVVSCAARDAAKAVDLRAALEARCGKETSKILLANTKASVAQDASGKKNRVLKLGASYISLKSV